MNLARIFALLLVLGFLPQFLMAQQPATEATPTRVFRAVSPSVVTITVETVSGKRQGSAVAVGWSYDDKRIINGTWFATNAHVVTGARQAQLVEGGRSWPAKIEYQDSTTDIALVHAPGLSLPVALPYGAHELSVGARVFAIGTPLGLDRSLSEGIVSALRQEKGVVLVQSTAAISPGSSGGALVDEKNRLVAITTFKLRDGDSLNFAVDAARIREIRAALLAARLFQAVYERKVVREGSEEDKDVLYIESDALPKWMLETRRPDGTPTYKWFSDRLTASMHFSGGNPDFEVFQAEFLATRPRSNPSGSIQDKTDEVRLTCRMAATHDGTYQFDLSVAFNPSRSVVNGRSAHVTADEIIFRTGKDAAFTATVNRFSLRARIGDEMSPNLLSGTCTKLEERKF